jgi:hypothetical protein
MNMLDPSEMVEETQLVHIEPEDILYLVTEITKRHDAGKSVDWYTQIAILHHRYPGSSGKLFAIVERMLCLGTLMHDKRMRGWSTEVPDNPECSMTNEVIFRATALAPLHIIDDKLQFDAEEFFSIVLRETDAEGTA